MPQTEPGVNAIEVDGRPIGVCSVRPARIVNIRHERLHDALREAADWLEAHYFDGEPRSIHIEHLQIEEPEESDDASRFSDWGGDWFVTLACDV